MPEKGHDDVDMYEYGSAFSFTPINARKETVRTRERGLLPGMESSKSLVKAPKQTPKSPSDRIIHHARPERPREATTDGRDARGMKIPDNRYEETDSDVEILGARKRRHAEPTFGSGNGHAGGCELEIVNRHADQS